MTRMARKATTHSDPGAIASGTSTTLVITAFHRVMREGSDTTSETASAGATTTCAGRTASGSHLTIVMGDASVGDSPEHPSSECLQCAEESPIPELDLLRYLALHRAERNPVLGATLDPRQTGAMARAGARVRGCQRVNWGRSQSAPDAAGCGGYLAHAVRRHPRPGVATHGSSRRDADVRGDLARVAQTRLGICPTRLRRHWRALVVPRHRDDGATTGPSPAGPAAVSFGARASRPRAGPCSNEEAAREGGVPWRDRSATG